MKIGSFTAEVLSEGRFVVFEDGHINRTPLDTSSPDPQTESISENSSQVGINPVLIQTGQHNILLDAGLGWGLDATSKNTSVSNVRTNLSIFGLKPEDISHVILSHLHYDHMAGSSYTGTDACVKPTFPNATYYINEKEWEYALSQVNKEQDLIDAGYDLDDFYRLIADDYVTILQDKNSQIVEGVTVIRTGGHTPGHQIVQIESNGEFAYYLGDIFPTQKDVSSFPRRHANVDRVMAWVEKRLVFHKAYKENALFFLYHSLYGASGRISADENEEDAYVFEEIPM